MCDANSTFTTGIVVVAVVDSGIQEGRCRWLFFFRHRVRRSITRGNCEVDLMVRRKDSVWFQVITCAAIAAAPGIAILLGRRARMLVVVLGAVAASAGPR
jgi:hypothetical protein